MAFYQEHSARLTYKKFCAYVLALALLLIFVYMSGVGWECKNCYDPWFRAYEVDTSPEIMVRPRGKGSASVNITASANTTTTTAAAALVVQTATSTRRHATTTRLSIAMKNAACLQHLLDNNIVEYYYPPDNDDAFNSTTRGLTSKRRLENETSTPAVVLVIEPSINLDQNLLPKDICSPVLYRFLPNMRARDYDLLRRLIKFFRHVARLSGMEYFLNYGSLLGHIRFNRRPIPWDDDVDFSVDFSVMKKFKRIFMRERKKYFGAKSNGSFFPDLHVDQIWSKVFDGSRAKISNYQWTFPFIDLFYYSTPDEDFDYTEYPDMLNSFVMTDALHSGSPYKIPLSAAMPFKYEPFLGIQLALPSNTTKILKILDYKPSVCRPLAWYHRFETSKHIDSPSEVDCGNLTGFYEF